MFITTGFDGRDISRLAIQMHEDEGLGRLADLGLLLDDRARQRGIDIPAKFFGIDEDGLGPEIGNGRGGGDEGQRGTEDFVAWTDASESQSKMQGRSAGRNSDGMFRADEYSEILFEGIEIGPGRCNPIGLESF